MNSKLEKILSEVTKLNTFDISSVLGAVNFMLLQRALNNTIRILPDPPPDEPGIDPFTNFEAAKRNPDIVKVAAPLIGMANRVQEVLEQYSSRPVQDFEDVLEFMTSTPRTRADFQREYDNRKRQGQEPSGGVRRFIDSQYQQAQRQRALLIAKGQMAIGILNGIEGTDEDVGEDVMEQIEIKVLTKLAARWYANDDRATSTTLPQEAKDEAVADRDMIAAVINELGGEAPELPKRGEPGVDVEQVPYKHPLYAKPLDKFIADNEGLGE